MDARGRPALGVDYKKPPFLFSKPLADPWGGTKLLGGRHPTQMSQPTPDADAPERVVFLLSSICQAMPAGLRLYGHPTLLAIAEAINGNDFVPFTETIFIKQPGLGSSVSWHQDGVTHWGSPDWDEGIHGFNFQIQLYPTTPGNCLWVVPGTHRLGRIDIKKRVAENGGSDQLPGAMPLVCGAGDVTVVNRQTLHGSFANSSPDLRVSMTYGFHRRASVIGQKAALGVEADDVFLRRATDLRALLGHRSCDQRAARPLCRRGALPLPTVCRSRAGLPVQRRDGREGPARLCNQGSGDLAARARALEQRQVLLAGLLHGLAGPDGAQVPGSAAAFDHGTVESIPGHVLRREGADTALLESAFDVDPGDLEVLVLEGRTGRLAGVCQLADPAAEVGLDPATTTGAEVEYGQATLARFARDRELS